MVGSGMKLDGSGAESGLDYRHNQVYCHILPTILINTHILSSNQLLYENCFGSYSSFSSHVPDSREVQSGSTITLD